jgi:drug/metabolite transporter (DMT)-like permease
MLNGYLFSALSVVLMATSPLLNKFAIASLSAKEASFWNTFFAALFSGLMWLLKVGMPKQLSIFSIFRFSKRLLLISVLNALGILCLFQSTALLEPATLSLLGRSHVIFSVFLGILFLNEKPNQNEWIWISGSVCGMILFSFKGWVGSQYLGLGLCLLYALLFSMTNFLIKKETASSGIEQVLFMNNFISLLLLSIFQRPGFSSMNISAISLVALGGLLSGTLGLFFFYESLKTISFSNFPRILFLFVLDRFRLLSLSFVFCEFLRIRSPYYE